MKKSQPLQSKPELSRRKRTFFIGIILCLPIVLLLATEGVLRLCGFGGNDPVLHKVGNVPGGSLILADQAGAISYFFANKARPGYNDQYQFVDPKPTNTFRIFIVGESAAKGYPQPRNLASSAFLQKMLADAWPERKVEIINLGTTAVASFPVLGMMTEALNYQPDLVIIHTGHNEFFGAYGVNSISRGGAGIGRLKLTRAVRSLALVQALSKWLSSSDPLKGKTLMEIMAAQSYTAPDDSIRTTAAGNLHANISEMLARCNARGVPVIVCTMPSNERDLFPVGEDKLDKLSADEQARYKTLLDEGEAAIRTDFQIATNKLIEATRVNTDNARAHFQLGRAYLAANQTNAALREFNIARDRDTMPWRCTSLQRDAIRQAASEHNATVCDLEATFRARSSGGCIGWELMDDHVHPTLRGQSLMAEAFVSTLRSMTGNLAVTEAQFAHIRPVETYTEMLGDNVYDRYAVDHGMRTLFSVQFMRDRNIGAYLRFDDRAKAFESTLSPEMKNIVREWQSETPHAGGKRPITGMIARQFMREKRFDEALKFYQIAQISVPEYTSWHMEYVYFTLACREKLAGKLNEEERKLASSEIEQGKFLLQKGFSQTGFTERYTGRLHQLRGEFAEAIPYLNASRQKLSGFELVAADQALFTSFVETGRLDEARKLAENGVAKSGQYADFYKQMLGILDQKRPQPKKAE